MVLQALNRSPTGTSGRKDQAAKHKARLALKVLLKLVIKPGCKVAYSCGEIRATIIALDANSLRYTDRSQESQVAEEQSKMKEYTLGCYKEVKDSLKAL